jgi:hypothetical protein
VVVEGRLAVEVVRLLTRLEDGASQT